jgi:hypothetical protein
MKLRAFMVVSIKMSRKLRILGLVSAISFVLTGCSGKKAPSLRVSKPRAPMILYGVDGLDWHVMVPLLRAGRMPVMAGLMSRGSYGYLESMDPTYSAVIWTSIATAKIPAKHGIENFVFRGKDGKYHYYTSGHRKTKAFWNILSDYGLNVDCIGWWITYPAEAINGTMVSQTNTTAVMSNPEQALWKGTLLKGVEGQVYPPEYQNHVMDLLEQTDKSMDSLTESIFGRFPNPPSDFGQLMWDQTIWAMRADAVYDKVALDILERGDPFDLLAVYVSGHRFWRYAYPEEFDHPPPPDQIKNFGHVIDDYYVYVDHMLGELIAAAPESTSVMIVSDHGMEAINTDNVFKVGNSAPMMNSGNHYDHPPGVFIATGPGFRKSGGPPIAELTVDDIPTVGGVLGVLPTILARKGIPLGNDFDGRPIFKVLEDEWLDVQTIKTHDTQEWVAARDARIRDAVAESERLDQLRSLGYIR